MKEKLVIFGLSNSFEYDPSNPTPFLSFLFLIFFLCVFVFIFFLCFIKGFFGHSTLMFGGVFFSFRSSWNLVPLFGFRLDY